MAPSQVDTSIHRSRYGRCHTFWPGGKPPGQRVVGLGLMAGIGHIPAISMRHGSVPEDWLPVMVGHPEDWLPVMVGHMSHQFRWSDGSCCSTRLRGNGFRTGLIGTG